jgi:hydroxyacylglutathione hydrolase
MELTGGIHRIDGVRGAHAYLVPAADSLYVVDTGMPGNATRILAYVESLGRRPKDVSIILLTHADMDHAGSAAELKRRTGAKIAIHGLEAPVLAGLKDGKRTRGALGVLMRVFRTFMKMEKIGADVMLVDGEKVGPLTVIAAPGHTEGTVCFISEGARTLIAGDALRTTGSGEPSLPPEVMSLDMRRARESAVKISRLSFDVMLPGHGGPILQLASEKVRELVRREVRQIVP